MPGQRAKDKVRLGGYINRKIYRQIVAAANKAGWHANHFGYFVHLLAPIVEAKYRKLKARRKAAARRRPTAKAKARSAFSS